MNVSSRMLCLLALTALSLAACGDDGEPAAETGADAGGSDGGASGSDVGADSDASTVEDAGTNTDAAIEDDVALEEDVADLSTPYAQCYPEFVTEMGINYSLQGAEIGSHCSGTNNQDISDIERVVFLGDSITAGVGASRDELAYREIMTSALREQFGDDLVVDNCSVGGAVNAGVSNAQIPNCFPSVEDRNTLVVITSGGNDIVQTALRKPDFEGGKPDVDSLVADLQVGLDFLADSANFPGGISVVYANVYEYTDATGYMSSCALAAGVGLTGQWDAGLQLYAYMEQEYVRMAVERGFDVMFLEELFCGHGWNREDPDGPCADRAGDLWISFDCIHPNDAGHAAIADAFLEVIQE